MADLDERTLISRSRRILLPIKPSEINILPAILDDIRPHIHPSCSLHLLAQCRPFISGGDGDMAYARGFHHVAILEATRDAMIQSAGETCWNIGRVHTSVCEGGLQRIIAAARDDLSDLILLATPDWTASRLARWKVGHLRRQSNCQVLVLPQPQRPANGLPLPIGLMSRALASRPALTTAS